MRRPILALAAAAFLSGGALAYAQGTPPEGSQSPRDQTKDQTLQPGARTGAEPRTAPDEMKPGGGTDRDMQRTQVQGGDRDQLQGGQMMRGGEERSEGPRALTVEQKANLRETVLRSGPRITKVNFRIGVGAVVPRTVRLVAVPQPILAIYPAWSGDLFFTYGDEIVVVAPDTMQIVGVLPL